MTTKIHLAVKQGQKPLSVVITAGQRGDSPQFEPVLDAIRVPRLGPGRPRRRPDRVRADKAYDSRRNRAYLRRRGIKATIPVPADRGPPPPQARLPGRPASEVRQERLPRAACRRVRHQSPQAPSCRGHAIRQARRPLRGHCAGRNDQRMDMSGSGVPLIASLTGYEAAAAEEALPPPFRGNPVR
ncbi:transposase [Streptomyces pilosus]|uniref:transposase n=1 Tax=Streptomyces pilosus TaxID=28893 RepID=UPI00363C2CF9